MCSAVQYSVAIEERDTGTQGRPVQSRACAVVRLDDDDRFQNPILSPSPSYLSGNGAVGWTFTFHQQHAVRDVVPSLSPMEWGWVCVDGLDVQVGMQKMPAHSPMEPRPP